MGPVTVDCGLGLQSEGVGATMLEGEGAQASEDGMGLGSVEARIRDLQERLSEAEAARDRTALALAAETVARNAAAAAMAEAALAREASEADARAAEAVRNAAMAEAIASAAAARDRAEAERDTAVARAALLLRRVEEAEARKQEVGERAERAEASKREAGERAERAEAQQREGCEELRSELERCRSEGSRKAAEAEERHSAALAAAESAKKDAAATAAEGAEAREGYIQSLTAHIRMQHMICERLFADIPKLLEDKKVLRVGLVLVIINIPTTPCVSYVWICMDDRKVLLSTASILFWK